MHPVIRVILAFVLPPLGVLDKGCGAILIVLLFTLLGWLPGVIAALVLAEVMDVIRAIVVILLPPLAVLDLGLGVILLTVLLTLAGYVPGMLCAALCIATLQPAR